MKRKTLLAVSVTTVVLLISGSVALAGGIGPFSAGVAAALATVQNLINGPEKLPVIDRLTGCDATATSTNCATVRTSQPAEQAARGLSTATSYVEVVSTQQSGKIDAHLMIDNTLKNITFCGGPTLKTRQVIINGVDVGQRIAQLASSDAMGKVGNASIGNGVCNSMPHNVDYTKGILEMRDVVTVQTGDSRAPGDNYFVNIGTMMFAINPVTNEIFNVSAYDGTLVSVGKLK